MNAQRQLQQKPYDELTIEEKIALLDAPEQEPQRQTAESHYSLPAVDDVDPDTIVPLLLDPEHIEDEDTDVIEAMQQLLLKHENSSLHKVEDPDLERVLMELRGIAHCNIADVFESRIVKEYIGLDDDENEVWQQSEQLTVKDITKLPREISACIQSVKITPTPHGQLVDVKMYDKQISLDKLMKFHGAYIKDNEQQKSNTDGIMDLLLTSIGSAGLPVITNNNA